MARISHSGQSLSAGNVDHSIEDLFRDRIQLCESNGERILDWHDDKNDRISEP
jgi:hypothetical protein